MARVLVPLAEGFEEIEAVTIIDLLRRAEIEVVVASLDNVAVRGSHGIVLRADLPLAEALELDYEMLVLPGGMPGADNLENDPRVTRLLRQLADSGKFTAAICAAPKVLASAGILDSKTATSFPGFLDEEQTPGLRVSDEPVVVDGRVTTSRGPGTAMDFALTLIAQLVDEERRETVESRLQRPSRD